MRKWRRKEEIEEEEDDDEYNYSDKGIVAFKAFFIRIAAFLKVNTRDVPLTPGTCIMDDNHRIRIV
jgi:hypothetical protein